MSENYIALFEKHRDSLSGKACFTVSRARENAAVELEAIGLPNNRLEYWKYSRIGKILNGLDLNLSNFKNTKKAIQKKSDSQYEICSLQEAIAAKHPEIEKYLTKYASTKSAGLTALNTAFFTDGIFINVPDSINVKEPIKLPNLYIDKDGTIVQARNLIVVGKNSSLTIINEGQSNTRSSACLTNLVEEIIVGENADVKQYVVQNGVGSEVNSVYVEQSRNSRYTRVTLTLNGSFVRNNVNVIMRATGCESNLYGYYHIRAKNQVDNHTIIEHKDPDCISNELYVGLLDDEASGIFNGRVLVHQNAQRTNAFQSNKNILLSDSATMNTKPELEIYADDVKCSHGATIGQVDPEALFYLQSRGIPKEKAMSMLLQGFSTEVTGRIADDNFRDKVEALILAQIT